MRERDHALTKHMIPTDTHRHTQTHTDTHLLSLILLVICFQLEATDRARVRGLEFRIWFSLG